MPRNLGNISGRNGPRVDVICVTKGDLPPLPWLRNLARLPVNRLIVENSSPLLAARWRAIKRVETEWFLFLDDDVALDDGWWDEAQKRMGPGVGAIQTRERLYGFGERWDMAINAFRQSKPEIAYGPRARGTCVATLIRTEAIRDWNPPDLDLDAYEDYLITQHIISRGWKWIDARLPAWHRRTWRKHFSAAIRDMRGLKRVESGRSQAERMFKLCLAIFLALLPIPRLPPRFGGMRGVRIRVFLIWQNIACIIGLLNPR